MKRQKSEISSEEIEAEWRRATDSLEFDEMLSEGDVILRHLLGTLVTSTFNFQQVLKNVSEGNGFGNERAVVFLPAAVADFAFEDGCVETSYLVEIRRNGFGDEPTEIARIPVSRFLYYVNMAVVFHERFVDHGLDVWETFRTMANSCSRKRQFDKLSPTLQRHLQSLRTDWWQP